MATVTDSLLTLFNRAATPVQKKLLVKNTFTLFNNSAVCTEFNPIIITYVWHSKNIVNDADQAQAWTLNITPLHPTPQIYWMTVNYLPTPKTAVS